jgi:hypothetical protein
VCLFIKENVFFVFDIFLNDIKVEKIKYIKFPYRGSQIGLSAAVRLKYDIQITQHNSDWLNFHPLTLKKGRRTPTFWAHYIMPIFII